MTHVTITSTARNCEKYAARCVRSVREQTHENFTHHYFDVGSTDDTYGTACLASDDGDGEVDPRIEIHRVPASSCALDALLPLWRALLPDEVIVWLDGDDELLPWALRYVVEAHEKGAWVTWGQFMTSEGEVGFAGPVGPAPRFEPWRATHLKTFRAGLVQRIDPEHLRDGYAWDQAVMIPCLEMAAERATFLARIVHVYNIENSFMRNAPPEEQAREHEAVRRIRSYPRYRRLEKL